MTGGDKYQPGWVDVSPETLKSLIRTFTGGTGTFIGDTIGLAYRGLKGVTPELHEIPIVRKFTREERINDDRSRYFKAAEEARAAVEQLAAARKNHDTAAVTNILAEKRELIAMGRMAVDTGKMLKYKRDAEDKIMQDDTMPLPEKRRKIKAMEKEESVIYDRYMRVFNTKEEERKKRLTAGG